MRRSIYKFALAAVVLVMGCCKEPEPVKPPIPASNVFLMYDNIGGTAFSDNVAAAGKAVAAGALRDGQKVIVYQRYSTGNIIYELVKDKSAPAGYTKNTLYQYAKGENTTLSKETIADVVGDVRTLAPADHYGLAFGSHGMGWLPKNYPGTIARRDAAAGPAPFAELWADRENPTTRFLAGYGEKIDIADFADALDEWKWDFVIFDDCFMASVEALYEIRHLADYFIASPTEILIDGFPYDRVVSVLFDDWTNLAGVAAGFVEAYRTGEIGGAPCATVAVVKSSELEALATTVRGLNLRPDELTSVDGIQFYERISSPAHLFYDLDDYLSTIRKDTAPTEYNAFEVQLGRTVVFKDHTDTFYSGAFISRGQVKIDHYSGLNVFIPWSPTTFLIPDYQQTEWYKTVYN